MIRRNLPTLVWIVHKMSAPHDALRDTHLQQMYTLSIYGMQPQLSWWQVFWIRWVILWRNMRTPMSLLPQICSDNAAEQTRELQRILGSDYTCQHIYAHDQDIRKSIEFLAPKKDIILLVPESVVFPSTSNYLAWLQNALAPKEAQLATITLENQDSIEECYIQHIRQTILEAKFSQNVQYSILLLLQPEGNNWHSVDVLIEKKIRFLQQHLQEKLPSRPVHITLNSPSSKDYIQSLPTEHVVLYGFLNWTCSSNETIHPALCRKDLVFKQIPPFNTSPMYMRSIVELIWKEVGENHAQ